MILLGVGNLGTALLHYNFYRSHNTKIVAGFDTDPNKIGKDIDGIPIYPLDRLPEVKKLHNVDVAILTVPVNAAKQALETVVAAGIHGVLNFTPTRLTVPSHVRIHHIDLTNELQTLIYFLRNFPPEEEDPGQVIN